MTYIDGHNVIHAIPELFTLFRRNPITAMQRLIGRVGSARDTVLVFDGKSPASFPPSKSEVVFVESIEHRYEKADNYILNCIKQTRNNIVVTNDAALASQASQLGAKIITPQNWYRPSTATTSPIISHKRGPGGTHTEWVKLFKNRPNSNEDE